MTCTCELAAGFGPWDALAAHPAWAVLLTLAAGWGVAQIVGALRKRGRP